MGEEQSQNAMSEQQQEDFKALEELGKEAGEQAAKDMKEQAAKDMKEITTSEDVKESWNKLNSNHNVKLAGVISVVIFILLILVLTMTLSKRVKKSNVKGNMKSSSSSKIRPGVVLGCSNGELIIKECKAPGNVMVIGAPGKGKSQCLSIPTLLNWKGSALVIDIKRELYAYTNKVQAKKGKVIVFDPEQNGHAYNPIKECTTVDSCQFLARSLIPTPKNTSDPMWTQTAQNILAAACFEGNKEGKTLPEISERILITEPEVLIEELINSKYRETKLLASSLKGTPEKTLGGIFTELRNAIILFATDPNIERALSKSEWSAETLEESATIYMRVSERQIETYKKVWNLIIAQVLRHLNSRGEHQDPPILLLLDELPRLGKVEGYVENLGTLRSKDVTIFTAAQSLAQFQLHYGKEATRLIMDTNIYKVCLSASDSETQEVFSKLAGKYERVKESISSNWTPGNFVPGQGKSKFTQWEERIRPETLAYIEKPLYFPPDKEAFQIDKAFWMNIPEFVNLQKESGGPITFISDEDFKSLSEFKRENRTVDIIKNVQPEENNIEYEYKQRDYEPPHKISNDENEDNDSNDNDGEEGTDNPGYIELFEEWKIK